MYLLERNKLLVRQKKTEVDILSLSSILDFFISKGEDIFYFSNGSNNQESLAVGKLISITQDYDKVENILEELSTKVEFENNHDLLVNSPQFFGYLKFPSNLKEEIWDDFNPVEWILPRFLYYRTEGKSWLIENQPESIKPLKRFDNLNFSKSVKDKKKIGIKIYSETSLSDWQQKFGEAIEMIKDKKLMKIVLSRKKEFVGFENTEYSNLIDRLNQAFPDCFNFLIKKNDSIFFGTSPELLIKVDNNKFKSEALAGSIQRGKNEEEDSTFSDLLLNDSKNLLEHKIVVDYFQSTLKDKVYNFEIDPTPRIKKLKNIQHLNTQISGEINSNQDFFKLLKAIFPTPAVCGTPKDVAIESLQKIEGFERGLFTGVVGWINLFSQAELYVAIRCGLVKSNRLTIFAGCGIVEDSNAVDEYEETELKLKAISDLFDVED
jgi:menaquinone-specific isochorismate synthase